MIPESRLWRTIGVGARRLAAWPFQVAAARATLKALANMDRRELADIGLNPSDVREPRHCRLTAIRPSSSRDA